MTVEMMAFRALLEKCPDTDVLREMIGFAAERIPRKTVAQSVFP
ncbi:hypothetical protein [Azospirillum brasilense]|nr:hypothetical protein [Azospirillum brasilense]